MKIKSLKDYYRGTFINPSETFRQLIGDKSMVKFSTLSVSIMALLYTLVYVFLILGGGQPYRPWLDIPLTSYYRYNVFFCAPSMFLGWILAAGVVHVISRSMTVKGNFEGTLSTFGFGIGIASWTTGIHDLLTSFLGAIHIINQNDYEHSLNSPTIWRILLWIQMIAYLLWFILLFSKSAKVVYGLKTGPSILLGSVGFIIYQLFFFIFNR